MHIVSKVPKKIVSVRYFKPKFPLKKISSDVLVVVQKFLISQGNFAIQVDRLLRTRTNRFTHGTPRQFF